MKGVTMTKHHTVECNNCHTTEELDSVDGWLSTVTMVGNQEALMRRMEEDVEPDYGDFCSLRCLGEWAFAQELLRSLDEEGGAAE
jgi:hypothetical protein